MPELPEVETIIQGLKKVIVNKTITNFDDRDKKVVQLKRSDIVSSRIVDVRRRAKLIMIDLDNQKSILVHLKMTGQFIWEKDPGKKKFSLRNRVTGGHPTEAMLESMPHKHTRAIFTFSDKSKLYFNDLRRFGWLRVYPTDKLINQETKELKGLGVEALSKEFTQTYLVKNSKRFPNKKIKQFLMDQSVIAGIGNIYSDEALYVAGVHPERKLKYIKESEWQKVHDGIIKSLKLGIKHGGYSADTYVNAIGKKGKAQEYLYVYGKEGRECNKCDGKIKRIKIGGRSSHYCPSCQK